MNPQCKAGQEIEVRCDGRWKRAYAIYPTKVGEPGKFLRWMVELKEATFASRNRREIDIEDMRPFL